MANQVEIAIQARDNTAPAMQSAIANSKRLTGEVKTLGGALNQVGAIASAFGNQQLAGLTAQAGIVANSFKSMREVIVKVGLLKGSIVGVALAMAGWVAQRAIAENQRITERIEQEKKAQTELAKSIEATALAQKTLNERMAEGAIGASKGGALKKQLEELGFAQAGRKAGVPIGDPITPLGTNPVKDAMAIKPADTEKQIADANKLIIEHREERRKLDEMMDEEDQAAVQALLDANISREEEEWAMADELHQSKMKAKEDEMAKEEEMWAIYDQIYDERKQREKEQQEAMEKTRLLEAKKWKSNARTFSDYTGAVAGGLGQLASIMEQGNKKQFKTAKALRYGEAVMSTASGIARAYADYPLWLAIPMSAIVAAAGAAQISAISSAQGPQAHGGVDYVPQDQTVLLQQGERVIKRDQNERLMEMIDGGTGGIGPMINLTVLLDGTPLFKAMERASRDGRLTISARAVA